MILLIQRYAGTIVFIHTEMKKSEVAYLKEYIEKEGTSVFNRAKSSGFLSIIQTLKMLYHKERVRAKCYI